MKTNILLLLALAVTAGCSTLRDNPTIKLKTTSTNDVFLANLDAKRRLSFVVATPSGEVRILSEVPPDVVVTSINEMMGKLKYKELEGELALKFSENVTQLGKRTVSVNVLMYALYRLHEMQVNNSLNDPNVRPLFEKIMDSVVSIAVAEETASTAQLVAELNRLLDSTSKQGIKIDQKRFDALLPGQRKTQGSTSAPPEVEERK
jgi:ketopantoate reductase